MIEVTTKIGTFDGESRSVPVTFTGNGIVHERRVNAVLKDDGTYDKAATKARVDEVALGVAQKMEIGVITMPIVEPQAPSIADATAA